MAKKPPPIARRRHAWDAVLLEPAEVSDIKAIAAQHPRGFAAIVDKICRVGEVSFAAGGEDGRRESDYAEGKRAVGINLRAVVAMKMQPNARGAPSDLPNSPMPPAKPEQPKT
jgi:hypothetical protein